MNKFFKCILTAMPSNWPGLVVHQAVKNIYTVDLCTGHIL